MLRVVSFCGALCIATFLQGCEEVSHPACSSYSKGTAGAVTDTTSCDTACDKGEGIQTTNYGPHEFKGTSGSGMCECVVSDSERRTACQDPGYSA
ncbi:unnamed protein product [Effrenium voratum]|uniref:Lipoprotein n=1 Tax=Effrenium voratum TaxID=2562239 RepID=A0AA36N9E3_9DINO|nr:unnamed protein product [Effrenium voratum]